MSDVATRTLDSRRWLRNQDDRRWNMSSSLKVVCSSHVYESCVLPVPIDKVWERLRLLDYSWSTKTQGAAELVRGEAMDAVGSHRKVFYKDGTWQQLQVSHQTRV